MPIPPIIDAHADTFYEVATRGADFFADTDDLQLTLPKLQRAGVAVQVFVAWTPADLQGEAATAHAETVLDALDHACAARPDALAPIATRADLHRCWAAHEESGALGVGAGEGDALGGRRGSPVGARTSPGAKRRAGAVPRVPPGRLAGRLALPPPGGSPSPPTLKPEARSPKPEATAAPPPPIGVLAALEGASPLQGRIDLLERFVARGVRVITLTWNHSNELASGCGDPNPGGLTPAGRAVLAAMEARGVIADVAHLARPARADVLARATRPVMCSHTGLRRFCDMPRNLADDEARAIAHAGGVIGLDFYPFHLAPEAEQRARRGGIEVLLRALDHLLMLVSPRAVGFGSDWDGFRDTLTDLRSADDLPHLARTLFERLSCTSEEIALMLGGNWARLFAELLPVAAAPEAPRP